MVEVRLVVASQPIVDHLQVLGIGWPQVQTSDGSNALLQCPHHWVSCVLQPGAAGEPHLQLPHIRVWLGLGAEDLDFLSMASLPPWWWQWGHGGLIGWRTRNGVAPTSCLSDTQLSAASPLRQPQTSAAGRYMVGRMLLQMAHTKKGTQLRLKLGGLYQLVAKHPHPTVSHWGDRHGHSSWIQSSWVSPSQACLGRCLGSCRDLVSPQNLLGGSDEAKMGSSHPRVSLRRLWLSPGLASYLCMLRVVHHGPLALVTPFSRRGTSLWTGKTHPGSC